MRQVWAGIAALWVFLSLVAVLAWTRVSPTPTPQATPTVLAAKGHGKAAHQAALATTRTATHATTQTSPPPP
jgi:hypothetical protein